MKSNAKRLFILGVVLIITFAVWTLLIQSVDVQPIGQNGTDVGFARFNAWFHGLTGSDMTVYAVTDWLGFVPIFVCMVFAIVGLVQWIKRKNIFKVDCDILILGLYYVLVIFGYLIFEMIPINYRPILINGFMEASYPSSTTLLVLSVMPTLIFQSERRLKSYMARMTTTVLSNSFGAFMVFGRLMSGVHWFTDIIGSVFLSFGLFYIYKSIVLMIEERKNGV